MKTQGYAAKSRQLSDARRFILAGRDNWMKLVLPGALGKSRARHDVDDSTLHKNDPQSLILTGYDHMVDISGKLPTIIAEYGDPNSLANQYIYADAQILCQYVGHDDPNVTDQTYYYVHDRLGSVRLVVDCNMVAETVTVKNIYTYSPFGNPYAGTVTETVYNPFQFTGQWFDAEINQYQLRARQYDPTMMRFMTRDPVRGKGLEPLTLHKYLYTANDPINMVDPTGRSYAAALVEPIMAGHSVHSFALGVTAVGVAAGNWNIISYGIALDRTILPVMAIAMAKTQFPRYDDSVPSVIRDYNDGYAANMGGGGPNWNLPKWAAIGTAVVLAIDHSREIIGGIVEFGKFIGDLLSGGEQTEIREGP